MVTIHERIIPRLPSKEVLGWRQREIMWRSLCKAKEATQREAQALPALTNVQKLMTISWKEKGLGDHWELGREGR